MSVCWKVEAVYSYSSLPTVCCGTVSFLTHVSVLWHGVIPYSLQCGLTGLKGRLLSYHGQPHFCVVLKYLDLGETQSRESRT